MACPRLSLLACLRAEEGQGTQPEQVPAQLLVVPARDLPDDLLAQCPHQPIEQLAASLTLWPSCLSRTANATNGWVSPRAPMVKRVIRMMNFRSLSWTWPRK
jgi:hypothetical protein